MPSYKLLTEVEPAREAGAKPSASAVYKSTQFLNHTPLANVTTLHELFASSVETFSSNNCLGYRPLEDGVAGEYVWWTYAETGEKVVAFASGLAGLGTTSGARVGVFGPNCPEWMVTMQVSVVYAPLCGIYRDWLYSQQHNVGILG